MISSRKQLIPDRSSRPNNKNNASKPLSFTPLGARSAAKLNVSDYSYNNMNNGSPKFRRGLQNQNPLYDSSFITEGESQDSDQFNLSTDHLHHHNNNSNGNANNDFLIPNNADFNTIKSQNDNLTKLEQENFTLKVNLNSLKVQLSNVPKDKLEIIHLNSNLLSENDKLKSQLDQMNKKLNDLQSSHDLALDTNNNNNATGRSTLNKNKVQEFTKSYIEQLESENKHLAQELEFKSKEISQLDSKNKDLVDKISNLTDEIHSFERNDNEQLEKIQNLVEDINTLKNELHLKDLKIDSINHANEEELDVLRVQVEELGDEVNNRIDKENRLNDQLQDLRIKYEQLNDLNNSSSSHNNDQSTRISDLERENHSLNKKLKDVQTDLRDLENEKSSLVNQVDDLQRIVNRTADEFNSNSNSNSDMINALQDMNSRLQKDNNELKKKNIDLVHKIDDLNLKRDDLDYDLNKANQRIERLENERLDQINQLNESRESRQNSDMVNYQNELRDLRELCNSLRGDNKELQSRLDSLSDENTDLLKQLDDLKHLYNEEIDKYTSIRDDLNYQLDSKESEIQRLYDEVKYLNETIDNLNFIQNRMKANSTPKNQEISESDKESIREYFGSLEDLYSKRIDDYESRIQDLKDQVKNSIPSFKYDSIKEEIKSLKADLENAKKNSGDDYVDKKVNIELQNNFDKLSQEKFELMKSINTHQINQEKLKSVNNKLSNEIDLLKNKLELYKESRDGTPSLVSNSEESVPSLEDSTINELNLKIRHLSLELKTEQDNYDDLVNRYNSMRNDLIDKLSQENKAKKEKIQEIERLQSVIIAHEKEQRKLKDTEQQNGKLIKDLSEELQEVEQKKDKMIKELKGQLKEKVADVDHISNEHEKEQIKELKSKISTLIKEKEYLEKTNESISITTQLKESTIKKLQQEIEALRAKDHFAYQSYPITPPHSIKRSTNNFRESGSDGISSKSIRQFKKRVSDLEMDLAAMKTKLKLSELSRKEKDKKVQDLKFANKYLNTELESQNEKIDHFISEAKSIGDEDTTNLLKQLGAKSVPRSSGFEVSLETFRTAIKSVICAIRIRELMKEIQREKEEKLKIKSNLSSLLG